MPRRPGVVQHPFPVVGDELEVAGEGLRPRALRASPRLQPPEPSPPTFPPSWFYPDGVSANFYCSFLAEIQQWASVGGTQGSLYIPDFVLPYYGSEAGLRSAQSALFQVNVCDFNMEPHTRRVAGAGVWRWRRQQPGSEHVRHLRQAGALGQAGRFLGRDRPEDPAGARRVSSVGAGRTGRWWSWRPVSRGSIDDKSPI